MASSTTNSCIIDENSNSTSEWDGNNTYNINDTVTTMTYRYIVGDISLTERIKEGKIW